MVRFSDDLFNNTEGSDFIVRKRLPLATQVICIFVLAFVALYMTAIFMSNTGQKTLFVVTLVFTIGVLSWLALYFMSRLRDLVLSTEFQNAMLASAARLSTRFCLITKRDGSIVYIDPGFQKLFPHFMNSGSRNIEGLLIGAGITNEKISRIFSILERGENDRVMLTFSEGASDKFQIMMSVEVLPRPKGYFLMRGRDYVEKRNDSAAATSVSDKSTLEAALNLLPEGIAVADGNGMITYVNRTLENWLGFDAGEIFMRPYRIGHIFYQYGGKNVGQLTSENFEGDIVLQRKDGNLVTMQVKQISLGRNAGISALIRIKGE